MPYPGKGKYSTRRPKSKSRAMVKKAGSEATRLKKLEAQVRKLTKRTTMRSMYKISVESLAVTNPYSHQQVIQPNFMSPVFQSMTNSKEALSYDMTDVSFEGIVQIESQGLIASPINCTLYVVSLKKEAAMQFITETQDGANLRANVDYTQQSMGSTVAAGLTLLNPDIFTIHAKRQFIVSDVAQEQAQDDVWVTNVKDANYRYSLKVPFKKTIKANQKGQASTLPPFQIEGWGQMGAADIEPTDRLYTFLFNNAATLDADFLYWSQNTLINGQVVQ